MKFPRFFSSAPLFLGIFCLAAMLGFAQSKDADAKGKSGDLCVEAQLVWGTNDETSPNPKHKAVDASIAKKLSESPFKWKNYFEEERKTASVALNGSQKLQMSESCVVELTNLGADKIEVKLVGKGKPV